MLEFVRTHQRWMQLLLLLLIIPSFAFFGIESYSRFLDNPDELAKVGGQIVTQQQLDAVVKQQTQQAAQSSGGRIDPRQLDTPSARAAALETLINEQALRSGAARARLTASDRSVQAALMSIPAIAALRDQNGHVNVDAYLGLLKSQGLTADQLETNIRGELVARQLPEAIGGTAILSDVIAKRVIGARLQQREVAARRFDSKDYANQVNPSSAQLRAYYDAHPQLWRTQERARVEYVVLSAQNVAASVKLDADAVRAAYQQNPQRYQTTEQRRASHILFAVPKDAKPADRDAVKARASQVLAELRRAPQTFAAVAKRVSQDPGSAPHGGDLGWFAPGTMPSKSLDAALFGLKDGGISDVVESEYGFHIVALTGVKPSQRKPFDTVKGELEADLRRERAGKQYNQMVETLTNVAFEQPDSLKPVADRLQLSIQSADGVTRAPNAALGANHPLNHPKLLQAIFAAEATMQHHNTEPVEVAPGVMVVARVARYEPAIQRSFDDVQTQVRAAVVAEQATQLAHQAAERAARDTTGAGFAKPQWIARDQPQGLPAQALEAVMRLPASKLPAQTAVDLGEAGSVVFRVTAVRAPDLSAERLRAGQAQLAQIEARAQFGATLGWLRDQVGVKRLRKPQDPTQQKD